MSDIVTEPEIPGGADDPQALTTVIVGLVGVILTFALVVALAALHNKAEAAEFERKVVAAEPAELRQVRAEQLEQINHYRWVDQNAGVVAIPVERAMELLIEESKGGSAAE